MSWPGFFGDDCYGYYLVTRKDGSQYVDYEESRTIHRLIWYDKIKDAKPLTRDEAYEWERILEE